MKQRDGDPWMPADAYGRSLRGIGFNLLVRDMDRAVAFHRDVLDVEVVYADADFAAIRWAGPDAAAEWCLHTDHTYRDHPLYGSLNSELARGIGAELRLYGRDPDAAEAACRAHGHTVLAGAMDKPHGLREAYLIDPDGYLWVPSAAI